MISPKTTGKNLHCKLLSEPLNMYITKSSEPRMLWRDVCDRNEALMMRILSCKYACMDAWITACVATEIRQGDGANFLPGKERYKCRHFYFYLTKIDQFLTTTYIILVCIRSVYLPVYSNYYSFSPSIPLICKQIQSMNWNMPKTNLFLQQVSVVDQPADL